MINLVFQWHRIGLGTCLALLVAAGPTGSPAAMAASGDNPPTTVNSVSPDESDTAYLDDSYKLGYGSRHDGLLLYVSVNSRDMHLLSNGRAHDMLRREGLQRIGFSVRGALSKDR